MAARTRRGRGLCEVSVIAPPEYGAAGTEARGYPLMIATGTADGRAGTEHGGGGAMGEDAKNTGTTGATGTARTTGAPQAPEGTGRTDDAEEERVGRDRDRRIG